MNALLLCALLSVPAFAVDFDGDGGLPPGGLPDWSGQAVSTPSAAPVAPGNVIFVMFDGVRWQEFLNNKADSFLSKTDKAPTFPGFWSTLAQQGVIYDDASISNRAVVSLPAYQSIFAGATQPCKDNDCGRITVETFPERLRRETGLPAEQVATFSAWTGIALAVEHISSATFVEAGKEGNTRLDIDTFPRALAHLKAHKPRFLYISLNDADHQGHAGNYPEYLAALRRYDAWLVELVATLDAMGDYGKNTTLLVTTDHGRGIYWDWKSHGMRPWARRIWMYARNPRAGLKGSKVGGGEHINLRPTIETLLGLQPCAGCVAPLADVLAP